MRIYLKDWKKEVDSTPNLSAEEKKARILPQQTLVAWEMIGLSLPAAIKFLLRRGTKFVNARVFCQDPLEQHFSKQRAKLGSNKNPDLDQYLRNENMIHLQGKLSFKRRGTNTEQAARLLEDINEPLPKRAKTVRRKIIPH